MQQVVQKESQEAMQTIYLTEEANTWSITQLNEWKHLQSQFLLSLQPICLNVFLFSLNFCILSHFKIIRYIMKSMITTSVYFVEIQLRKENLKSVFWVTEFGCPNGYTSLPNSLNTSMYMITEQRVSALNNLVLLMFFT